MGLGVDLLVGLVQDVPALAVAEDHVAAAQIAEHRRADFAGKRAIGLVVDVLGSQGDLRAGNRLPHGIQVAGRRTDGQFHAIDRLGLRGDRFGQSHGGRTVEIHLPVSGNQRASHPSNSLVVTRKSQANKLASDRGLDQHKLLILID